jgi:hypothetical protein
MLQSTAKEERCKATYGCSLRVDFEEGLGWNPDRNLNQTPAGMQFQAIITHEKAAKAHQNSRTTVMSWLRPWDHVVRFDFNLSHSITWLKPKRQFVFKNVRHEYQSTSRLPFIGSTQVGMCLTADISVWLAI